MRTLLRQSHFKHYIGHQTMIAYDTATAGQTQFDTLRTNLKVKPVSPCVHDAEAKVARIQTKLVLAKKREALALMKSDQADTQRNNLRDDSRAVASQLFSSSQAERIATRTHNELGNKPLSELTLRDKERYDQAAFDIDKESRIQDSLKEQANAIDKQLQAASAVSKQALIEWTQANSLYKQAMRDYKAAEAYLRKVQKKARKAGTYTPQEQESEAGVGVGGFLAMGAAVIILLIIASL